MKNKITYIFLGLAFLLAINSCQDEFLKEEPTTFLSSSNLYDDADDARLVLTGMYSTLQAYRYYHQYGIMWFFGDMGVDIEVMPNWTYQPYQHTPSYTYVADIWEALYQTIYRANVVLNRVGQMDDELFENVNYGDEQMLEKNVILGEAYFLRALSYFNAVMIYGNVPLILEETTDLSVFPSQATPLETYEQVIADLQMAEALLPWIRRTGEEGHATKGAAKSILGKVYLQMTGFPTFHEEKYSLAAQKFEEVIDSDIYGLLDRYGDVFSPFMEDSKEWIFVVKYDPDLGQPTNTGSFMGLKGDVSQGAGYTSGLVNEDFAATFDSSDVRFWWNFSYRDIKGRMINLYCYPWKYHTPPGMWPSSSKGFDYPVLRYADILLMYAEALVGANDVPPEEAYEAVNQVRRRARLKAHDTDYPNNPDWVNEFIAERLAEYPPEEYNVLPDLENLTKEEFLSELLEEQAKELCWEGQRKPMLIRTGKLKEYITQPRYQMQEFGYLPGLDFKEDRDLWWPIPQRELDINPNLVQNPGEW